jgi:hypothetical protein
MSAFRWNRPEVIATTVVCTATVGLMIWGAIIYSDGPASVSEPNSAGVEAVTPAEPVEVPVSTTYSVRPDAAPLTLGDRGSYTAEAKPPAPVNVTPPAAAPESEPTIPACKNEDGSDEANPCLWDGKTMGNKIGLSYIVFNGEFYYLEGSGLNTHFEGDPMDLWPTGPSREFDPGPLMCGVTAAPALDTDQYGNNWAYCEPALVEP